MRAARGPRELFGYELEPGLVDEVCRAMNGNYALRVRQTTTRREIGNYLVIEINRGLSPITCRSIKFALFAIILLSGCNLVNDTDTKPVIQLRLDAPVSEVQAYSTYKFPQEFLHGIPGREFVLVPHIFIYKDDTLSLRIEDAGGLETLGTHINYDTQHGSADLESIVNHCSVHVLPDYSTLQVALERVGKLRNELLTQKFLIEESSWKNRFDANWEAAPPRLDSFQDIKEAFVDSAFFVKSATILVFKKDDLRVELKLINGRRKWGSRTDSTDRPSFPAQDRAAKEARTMSRQDLLAEASYSLMLNIGPTDAWMKKREDMREAQRKIRINK